LKAVIYARNSTEGQREESIEGQLRECTQYCDKNGITIVRHYIDRAFSAKTDNRPEFLQMIKDSAKGLFDMVIVWKLDRFSRNRYDSAHYKALLRKNGVKVVSATENIADGPEGIILESLLEGMAEYYSAELSVKVTRGHTENALKCKTNGGTLPLGYCSDSEQNILIDPITAAIPIEIFTRYDNGETIKEICDELNSRGLKTRNGKKFKVNGVSIILSNRKYIGEYRYRDVVTPDGIPAIIDKDMFERVQERMAKNKRAPARKKAEDEYLLTTKLFCGTCGRIMAGESGTSGTRKVKHYYYKCGGAKRHLGCTRKAIKKDWIEKVVVLQTVARVLKDEEIERIADALLKMQEQEDTTIPAMQAQLKECEKAIENMLNAIQSGILTESTKGRLEQLEEQQRNLKTTILRAEIRCPKYSKERIVNWISRFKGGNPNNRNYQRQIIDTFVNSVYVYDDKLVFTYNFKDGTETITLEEIEAAFGSDLNYCAPPKQKIRTQGRSAMGSDFLFYSGIYDDRISFISCLYILLPRISPLALKQIARISVGFS